ncbi:MAG: Fe-S-binding domain-containing protein, partial [Gemmatimonadaceae bacterium]
MGDASMMATALNVVLFLPLVGMALLMFVPSDKPGTTRGLTLLFMIAQFVITVWLYRNYSSTATGLQFETRIPWIASWGVFYHIGIDGFNVLLVLLTAFLAPLVVAGAFSAIQKDIKLFYAMVFLIQFAMMGTFLAQDLFLFYVFWELMLIPMFIMIGIWGGA